MNVLVELLTEQRFDSDAWSVRGGSGLFSVDPEQSLPPHSAQLEPHNVNVLFFFFVPHFLNNS